MEPNGLKENKLNGHGSFYQDLLLKFVPAFLRVQEIKCTNSPLIFIIFRYKKYIAVSMHLIRLWIKMDVLVSNKLLLIEQEVSVYVWENLNRGIQYRPWVQTERSEVCTHDRGQNSPIQTD